MTLYECVKSEFEKQKKVYDLGNGVTFNYTDSFVKHLKHILKTKKEVKAEMRLYSEIWDNNAINDGNIFSPKGAPVFLCIDNEDNIFFSPYRIPVDQGNSILYNIFYLDDIRTQKLDLLNEEICDYVKEQLEENYKTCQFMDGYIYINV